MAISYDPNTETLTMTARHGQEEVAAPPFYLQLCPFRGDVLRAYFSWPHPLNVEMYAPDHYHLGYNGYYHDGFQAIVQRTHACHGGQAFHALALALSLERVLREKLYYPAINSEYLEQLWVAASRIVNGEVDPSPFILVAETVEGKDHFLALPRGAQPLAETPASGSAYPRYGDIIAAFLPWLERVFPFAADALRVQIH
ncbi:MAG: hypothetical protein M0T85_02310 [Dehalococcoidales bacterium]|nr:hypothetical protein [Dehalococcoidales bacterium]